MNNLKLNNDLYFQNNFSLISQFSNGIEYCDCEQQIDLVNSLVKEKTKETTFFFQVKQILSPWKNLIINYSYRQIDKQENDLAEKSQLVLKNLSHDAAWVYSLLALTSLGITSEIAHRWSDSNLDLSPGLPSLESPSLATPISLRRFANQLFPLLEIEEIELVTLGAQFANNLTNILGTTITDLRTTITDFWQINSSKINNWYDNLQFLQPITPSKPQMTETQLPTSQSNSRGSLMAMPPLPSQASLSGFVSFLPKLELVDLTQDSDVNQSNSSKKSDEQLSSSLPDSIPSNTGGKLMAMPETGYQPHLPKIELLGRRKLNKQKTLSILKRRSFK